jgi:hypothetical protein
VVNGPTVMSGFLRDPAATRQQFTPDGFLRTGDLGYLDEAGNVCVTGRLREVVIRAGVRIFAPDLDRAVMLHPGIAMAKTIAISDPDLGERLHTVCVPGTEPPTVDELKLWLAERIRPEKRPDGISYMPYLPRGQLGDVQTQTLTKIVTGAQADEIYARLTRQKLRRAAPRDPEGMRAWIQASLVEGSPIRFAAFWGCGSRDFLNELDVAALTRLRYYLELAGSIPEVRPRLVLILADIHARINQCEPDVIENYFAAVEINARGLDFECVRLSDLWRAGGLSLDAVWKHSESTAFDDTWNTAPQRALITSAGRRDPDASEQQVLWRARRYYAGCLAEQPMLTNRFHRHIWLTYNDPDVSDALPDLPHVYLFSYRSGVSSRPWFEGDASESAVRRGRQHARVRVDAAIEIRFRPFDDFEPAVMVDISEGGTLVTASDARDIGDPIQLRFAVDGHPVEVHAEVVRLLWSTDGVRMGLKFAHRVDERLVAWVREHAKGLEP